MYWRKQQYIQNTQSKFSIFCQCYVNFQLLGCVEHKNDSDMLKYVNTTSNYIKLYKVITLKFISFAVVKANSSHVKKKEELLLMARPAGVL